MESDIASVYTIVMPSYCTQLTDEVGAGKPLDGLVVRLGILLYVSKKKPFRSERISAGSECLQGYALGFPHICHLPSAYLPADPGLLDLVTYIGPQRLAVYAGVDAHSKVLIAHAGQDSHVSLRATID